MNEHHGSHRHLLLDRPDAPPTGGIDAIIVPTVRPAAYLRDAASVASKLGCRLVAICSGKWTAAERLDKDLLEDVDLYAVDLPAGYDADFETARLLRGDALNRRADTAAKRNFGLALSAAFGWDHIVFLDDDIEVPDPDDLLRAAGLLDQYGRVALNVGGFPDHSVVCHANRETGGVQEPFVGAGALAVHVPSEDAFFPSIYNEDWLFLLRDRVMPALPVTGQVTQQAYDPYRSPARAMTEEFGEVLAEGLYWLLDEEGTAEGAGTDHWRAFIDLRRRFIEDVLNRLGPGRRRMSLEASRTQLSLVDAEMCTMFLKASAADRDMWRAHLQAVRAGSISHSTPPRPPTGRRTASEDRCGLGARRARKPQQVESPAPGAGAEFLAPKVRGPAEFLASKVRGPGETGPVTIRQALDQDLPALVRTLGQWHYFAHALERQRDGHGVLLVAWRADVAIGHIYVWLAEAEEEELQNEMPGVPLLTHLEIHPDHRRRGFGTALVHKAEQELIGRGHDRVILGVGLDNHAAMALYIRHGFRNWKEAPIETSETTYDESGRITESPDKCWILIKPISPHPSELDS